LLWGGGLPLRRDVFPLHGLSPTPSRARRLNAKSVIDLIFQTA
jgi:hypothetical protein